LNSDDEYDAEFPISAIIDGDYKLILNNDPVGWYDTSETQYRDPDEDETEWLFNLEDDPDETNNLYDSYPDQVDSMKSKLSTMVDEMLVASLYVDQNLDFAWEYWADHDDALGPYVFDDDAESLAEYASVISDTYANAPKRWEYESETFGSWYDIE